MRRFAITKIVLLHEWNRSTVVLWNGGRIHAEYRYTTKRLTRSRQLMDKVAGEWPDAQVIEHDNRGTHTLPRRADFRARLERDSD